VKPAAIPSSKPGPVAKPAAAPKPVPAATPAQASAQPNQLKRVNVVPGADSVQIEITSAEPVTPRVSRLKSPDRVLVELPETVIANSQNKIPVGSVGVKGVRIGMDGKTPPTTSVVIDLEKPLAYELTPGPQGKVILTLHSEGAAPTVAKNVPAAPVASVKAGAATAVKAAAPATAAKAIAPAPQSPAAGKPGAAPKIAVVKVPAKPDAAASKADSKVQAKASPVTKIAASASPAPLSVPVKTVVAPKPKEEKKWAMSGKRDPFFSPVVQQNGSGCSTGKKCLEIGAINLRGVVKSESGFIAVVTNNLNKAYFLRENDPVFNGYVVKITGDSVVFQETIQDKLGKSFTREVVKRIFTPAV
jgi:Tfp pilus assembly protein PilP